MPRSDRNKNAPANWTRAFSLAELGERSKAVVKLSGKQILLMQSGGKIYACNNRCPKSLATSDWVNGGMPPRQGVQIF